MNNIRCNRKGMTLVEIIVVLLISSLLMALAGGIILNSIGFFNRETKEDNNKYIVDSIASLMQDKLLYATDIKIATQKPGLGWNWFSINEDGFLYLDDDELWNSDFYNNNKLKLAARIYDSNRIDLILSFVNSENQQVYRTVSTINLVNKDPAIKDDTVSNGDQSGLGTTSFDISSETGNKIYFKMSVRDIIDMDDPLIPNPPNETEKGTVADEINCLDKDITKPGEKGNNKGEFSPLANYITGDFVKYDKVYYRASRSIDAGGAMPNLIADWKKIVSNWDENSIYRYGDIVMVQYKYYQAIKPEVPVGTPIINVSYWSSPEDSVEKLISKTGIDTTYKNCPCYMTVGDEIYEKTPSNNKGVYMSNINYKKGDFVTYNNKWYRAVEDLNNSEPGITGYTKWKTIDRYWNGDNSYMIGDIIIYPKESGGDQKYYQAKKDIKGGDQKKTPVNSEYWTLLDTKFKTCDIKPAPDK